tara:strand:+ start:1001 stop:2068 length:1068 start_codon:yes stop_codon:yes gene_type:complete
MKIHLFTFNFNMKNFLLKISITFIIVCLNVLLINYFGDAANLFSKSYESNIVKILKKSNVKNISNFDERIFQREFIYSSEIKPDVVAIGSSRVLKISSDLFKDQVFINNGVSGASMEDLIAIFQMYKAKRSMPSRIILGVDPWIFNKYSGQNRWQSIEKEYNKYYSALESKKELSFINSKYGQLLSPSYFQASLKKIIKGDSYTAPLATSNENNETSTILKDGSRTDSRVIQEITNSQVMFKARSYIEGDLYSLENYDIISIEIFEEFKSFCSDILDSNIELSFFLSPYHPLVYQKIKDDYNIVLDVEKKIIEFADDKNIKLIGSFSPLKAGLTSEDFNDGMHLKKSAIKLLDFN